MAPEWLTIEQSGSQKCFTKERNTLDNEHAQGAPLYLRHAILISLQEPKRRKWQPTPVFLPGEFHGQRSLEDVSAWDHSDSDMTELLIYGKY